MPAEAAGGPITGWWSTGSCSAPGLAARGVTCPVSTDTGRPHITGIAAGHWTGPGRRSWAGCGPGAMRSRARTGPSAPLPPWSARTRLGTAMADKAYSSAANRAYLRKRGITAVIPVKEDQKKHRRNRGRAGGRPPSTPHATRSAIPSSAASPSSGSSAPSPPAMTNATRCTRPPSTSPRSGSGYETRSHDLPDTP